MEWLQLTDDIASKLKHLGCYKIRLQNKKELSAFWDKVNGAFLWGNGEDGAYMDDPVSRATHIYLEVH